MKTFLSAMIVIAMIFACSGNAMAGGCFFGSQQQFVQHQFVPQQVVVQRQFVPQQVVVQRQFVPQQVVVQRQFVPRQQVNVSVNNFRRGRGRSQQIIVR